MGDGLGTQYYRDQISVHTGSDLTPQEIFDLGREKVTARAEWMRALLAGMGIDEEFLPNGLQRAQALIPSASEATDREQAHRLATDFYARTLGTIGEEWGVSEPPPLEVSVLDGAGSASYTFGAGRVQLFSEEPVYLQVPVWNHEAIHYLQDLAAGDGALEGGLGLLAFFGSSAVTEGTGLAAEMLELEKEEPFATEDPALRPLILLAAHNSVMLREVRLVVDTGIHALGWNREQAIDFMKAHLLMSDESIAFEVDRMISWPAQALSYSLGADGVIRQTARARSALGEGGDLSAFLRMVLRHRGGTLRSLQIETDRFLRERAQSGPGGT